eukprot:TRINITY_DN38848_c0_g1_i1.p1 TRINITY_DN38848_c0_g1~~TRINITY_DN38848_c0_g1_i1.p1  ORF type:complete len:372 (+),score=81.19 TRINITY_DN38848_c0_g1_i1:32-1117(+)
MLFSCSGCNRKRLCHYDDIHGFLKTNRGFVTGSKDKSLNLWSPDLKFDGKRKVMDWVTCLGMSEEEGNFFSGERNGYVRLWQGGDEVACLKIENQAPHICKDRNWERVMAVAPKCRTKNGEQSYVGTACAVHLISSSFSADRSPEMKLLWSCNVSENDWVYCIEPLREDPNSTLTVIGSDLFRHKFSKKEGEMRYEADHIVKEVKSGNKYQRPFISAITRLASRYETVACAVFDGSVKHYDLERGTMLRSYNEHPSWKRVWSVMNVDGQEHLTVSSAEDGSIKFWDDRTKKSAFELQEPSGNRVSCIQQGFKPCMLYTASCAKDPKSCPDKATITTWDLIMREAIVTHGPRPRRAQSPVGA